MKKLFYLLAALSGFFFQFCTYAPNGAHFEEVDPTPKTDGLSLTLGNSEDTLRVRGTAEVHYTLNLPHLALYKAQFLLNGKPFYTTQNKTGSFSLQSNNLPDGVHEIKVLANTTTGTNSLADKLEAEQLEVYRTWKILVDNAGPSKVKVTAVEIVDGRLRVSWEKYKRIGFRSYMVYKHNLETNHAYSFVGFVHRDSTSWTDHSYLGGKVGFSIVVWDDKGSSSEGEIYPFEVSIPKIKTYQPQNERDLRVHFSPTRLYRNFGDYFFTGYTSPSDWRGTSLFKISNLNDTVATVRDLPFGGVYRLQLITLPKHNHHQMGDARHEVQVSTGTKFYSAHPLYGINIEYYTPETQMFYGFARGDTLIALRGADLSVVSKARLSGGSSSMNRNAAFTRAISPNGKYVYVAEGDRILRLDPVTLVVMQAFPVQNLVKNPGFAAYGVSVSNNNRLAIGAVNPQYADTVYVIDMDRQKILFKQRNTSAPRLSRDGKMLQLFKTFYRETSSGVFTPFIPVQGTSSDAAFHPSADQVVIETFQTISIYNTGTGGLIRSFPRIQFLSSINIDAATGHLGSRMSSTLYGVYDLYTGRQVKTIPLGDESYPYTIHQNKLFANDRFLPLGL